MKTGVTVATRIADWIAAATGVGAFKTVFNLLVTIYQRAKKIIQTALQVLKVLGAGLQAAANFNAEDVAKVVNDGLRVAVKALLELMTLLLMLGGLINSIQATICTVITRIRAFVAKIIAWLFKKKKKSCKTGMCNMPGRGAPKAGDVKGGQSCTLPPKKGPMPMMKCGNCFIEGTPAKNGADRWQQLEEVVLGQRLRTWEPGELGYAASLTIPDTVIDPTTWRAFWFVQEHADGYKVEVGMLRPLSWLEEHGAEDVGDWVALDLPEMGVEGAFQLLAVDACPTIEQGEGRVVLSVYRFSKGQTWNLLVSGMPEPLGVTALHPIWSADRRAWVAVGELLIGERVLVSGGVQVVLGLSKRGVEKVYNVEVDGDHCYRVGEAGVLVHNQSCAIDNVRLAPPIPNTIEFRSFNSDASQTRAGLTTANIGPWNDPNNRGYYKFVIVIIVEGCELNLCSFNRYVSATYESSLSQAIHGIPRIRNVMNIPFTPRTSGDHGGGYRQNGRASGADLIDGPSRNRDLVIATQPSDEAGIADAPGLVAVNANAVPYSYRANFFVRIQFRNIDLKCIYYDVVIVANQAPGASANPPALLRWNVTDGPC